VLSDAVAEVGMLLLLGAARRVTESVDLIRSGRWTGWTPTQLNGTGLAGKALGIVGMGRIGRAVARRARAFDMAIHYTNRSRLPADPSRRTQHADTNTAARRAMPAARVPGHPDTTGLLVRAGCACCRAARRQHQAQRRRRRRISRCIAAGHVAAAGLVCSTASRPCFALLRPANVFMLPHIRQFDDQTRVAMARLLVDGLQAFAAGRPAAHRLD
jgi:glyoxylate reductase